MKRLLFSLVLVLLTALPASAQELLVSAAASLTDAFTQIEAQFEKAHPGVDVICNFASSGALFRQISQGAPADVYASANQKWMNKAVTDGFIVDKTRVDFVQNTLVLATPADNPAKIKGVKDLFESRVGRVCLGTPETVPAGQYAKTSLQSLDMWDKLKDKYVFAEHVRQVLDYLRRGEVDAGLVYGSDAVKGGKQVAVVQIMPLPKPPLYPVAVLKSSDKQDLAKAFVDYLLSDAGQSALEKWGFARP